MKICDLTQFYSPFSGGVKRYVHEKASYIQRARPQDEHVLIVPGAQTAVEGDQQARVYSVRSPLISRRSRYRALLNLNEVARVLGREKPDLIESGDPYQMAWKALKTARSLGIPSVAFYHSHFPEAYLRGASRWLGSAGGKVMMDLAKRYVCSLYSKFAVTLVPSQGLAEVLRSWGLKNIEVVELGVDTAVFSPAPDDRMASRESLGIPGHRLLLLYVGRLAQEKNTQTLFSAYRSLVTKFPDRYHLLVIGDGLQRGALHELVRETGAVTWRQYCTDSAELARAYRAADLFVHPGVQETFGLVAVESQACGTPVLGIRGSFMDQVICHDQRAWATENSPAAFARALERFDASDLPALGLDAAAEVRARYSWDAVFARLFCIYEQVCAHYRQPRS